MKMLCKLILMSGVAMATAASVRDGATGRCRWRNMMGEGGTGMISWAPMGPGMLNQGMMGPGTCSMMGGMGQGMMMGWGMMNPALMGMMMGGPAAQGRLAYMKAELGITDAQTAAGESYASAVNARVTSMQEHARWNDADYADRDRNN